MVNMKKFLEQIEANEELKARIEELSRNPKAVIEDFIRLAAEYGVILEEEKFLSESESGEASDSL